jgi:hypothetical protein
LRSANNDKIWVVDFFVDTLPHGHVKEASSP